MKKVEPNAQIEIESIGPLTPLDEAFYELGKNLLKSSISTATDFCKFMITVSTGAIPIYLALLGLVLPENGVLSANELLLSVVPPFLFLIGAIIFIFGYFPKADYQSLEIIEEIRNVYEKTIFRRRLFIYLGILVFLIASVTAIFSVLLSIFFI